MIIDKKKSKNFLTSKLFEVLIYSSWEEKNVSMVYDWHQEIMSPSKPKVSTSYHRQSC